MLNLDEIKKRCEAATPGPWNKRYEKKLYEIYLDADSEYNLGLVDKKDNADFIAHARQDVPALIAEVERLTAWAAGLERAVSGNCKYCKHSDVKIEEKPYKRRRGMTNAEAIEQLKNDKWHLLQMIEFAKMNLSEDIGKERAKPWELIVEALDLALAALEEREPNLCGHKCVYVNRCYACDYRDDELTDKYIAESEATL